MAPSHGELRTTRSVAVLGAETAVGARVRAALEAAAVPSDRVALFRATDGEPTLSEYAGEARLIQSPDPDVVGTHGVVIECGSDAPSGDAANVDVDPASVLRLDLTGASGAPLADPRTPASAEPRVGAWTIPQALSLVLFELLEPLRRGPGFERATVTILRPAGDLGDAGVEELRLQVAGLLGFSDVPTETLGRRLAFNCYPETTTSRSPADRIAGEVRTLLGVDPAAVAVRILWVPVFFGHGISVHLTLPEGGSATAIDDAWATAERIEPTGVADDCSPQATTGDRRTLVAPAIPDGAGGVWLWAVADEAASASAFEAVRFASIAGRS